MGKFTQIWLAVPAALMAGCLGVGTEQPQITQHAGSSTSVCSDKWQLKRLRVNGETVEVEDSSRYTFVCNPAGDVVGKSGINTFRGSVKITDNGQMIWDTSSFASTKMSGPDYLMQQENAYLGALAGTRQALTKSGGNRLILRNPSGDIYIEYVRVNP
ncbi:META domain-containing protein [Microbulbifer sp. 2201CG32-9]|uniref:META domain-containing protein n=1 Tax=unclassified Microbulbifer TaxID=2619833 RepID=UPI00345B9C72